MLVALALGACSGPPRLESTRPAVTDETFLVTPRWSEDGRKLVAAGRGGQGLHLLDLAARRREAPDPELRERPRLAPTTSGPATAGEPAGDDPRGRLVARTGSRTVWFDAYRGRIVRDGGETTPEVLVEVGAWGVVAAPDGWVAWCTGHLALAELYALDPAGGRLALGPGAQPAWARTAPVLVFARPEPAPESGEVVRSDLWAWDRRTGRHTRLTRTPDVVEMEPAVSPDGERLAFSDWRSGRVLLGDFSPD